MKRPEQAVHRSIVHYLRATLPPIWIVAHAANGGYRTKVEAAIFKTLGVVPGFPDLMVLGETVKGRNTWFLEIKAAKNGRLSDAQRACHDRLWNLGFPVAVVHSVDEAREAARLWGLPLREVAL